MLSSQSSRGHRPIPRYLVPGLHTSHSLGFHRVTVSESGQGQNPSSTGIAPLSMLLVHQEWIEDIGHS